ncbi:MAG: YXWGXW repeat-containing protein [Gemmataceae bacterium]|nr:YXWGXW repeat-containing protein [Gemmataceae bacterium]
MSTLCRCAWCGGLLAIVAFLGPAPVHSHDNDAELPDGVEIQVRGPVHEAFAQPNDPQVGPGPVVPKAPPAPIPEEPPAERPEGNNVQFIPGYWAWDPENNRFIWVSGTYRNAPPGRQWIPGHWEQTDGGWRWIPGYWAPEQQPEPRYVPEPPAPLDTEPNVAPPGDDFAWIPGTWVYRDTRFVWRPGYWSPFRVGRVWVPACYYWTPYGYIFNDGYWDYPFDARGVLFAPVWFSRPLWLTPGWCWRPTWAVGLGCFYDSCFVRVGCFGFFFGNFYGPACFNFGYRPWFNGCGRFNPGFAYYRWQNRLPNTWVAQQQRLYDDRAAGRAAVPPRDFAQQLARLNDGKKVGPDARVVAPLGQIKSLGNNIQLVKQTPAEVQKQKALADRTQEVALTRAKRLEAARVGDGANPKPSATLAPKNPPASAGTGDAKIGSSIRIPPKDASPSGVAGQTKPTGPTVSPRDGPRPLDGDSVPKLGKVGDGAGSKTADGPRGPDAKSVPKISSQGDPKVVTTPKSAAQPNRRQPRRRRLAAANPSR